MICEDIVIAVQKHIDFFRDKFNEFCQRVEEYAGTLDRLSKEADDQYKRQYAQQRTQIDAEVAQIQRDVANRKQNLNRIKAKHDKALADYDKIKNKRYDSREEKEAADKLWQRKEKYRKEYKAEYERVAELEGMDTPKLLFLTKAQRAGPPKPDYVWITNRDTRFCVKVSIPTPFWGPKEPVNPIAWFDLPRTVGISVDLSDKEQLLHDVVILSVVHDANANDSLANADKRVFLTPQPYQGKYFLRVEFARALWDSLKKGNDTKIINAWNRVEPYLSAIEPPKPTERKEKVPFGKWRRLWTLVKRIPRWICGLIGAVFVAVIAAIILDIIGDFGWIESIKTFIYRIVVGS